MNPPDRSDGRKPRCFFRYPASRSRRYALARDRGLAAATPADPPATFPGDPARLDALLPEETPVPC